MPDLGIVTLNDMLDNASMIASLNRSIPLIADADTGYGGPILVARTVRSYIAAGIAGLHLEDQVVTKRCGHLAGKELVDEDTYLSRIRAAAMARDEMRATTGGDIVLIARTDALQSLGYDEAVHRLKQAVDVGADVAFLEGPTTVEQCRRVCRDLAPTPVLLNMVPGGVTPAMSVAKAQEIGFRVMIHPGLALAPVYEHVANACRELKMNGKVDISERQMKEGVKGVFTVCGLVDCMQFDAKAGGSSYRNGT
jgi:2-methylisocitrate lyase-like PEP mutase family enzyme